MQVELSFEIQYKHSYIFVILTCQTFVDFVVLFSYEKFTLTLDGYSIKVTILHFPDFILKL